VWNETQDLAIREMSTPWETVGDETTLSRPAYPWEVQTHTVNEGPIAISRKGRTFVVYSASACWGPDYKLGLLEYKGGDPLDVESWTKYPDPVFERADDRGVFAPGHNTFFKSPDGTEDWMAYHANDQESDVCDMGRTPRIQRFTWNEDGTPNFGLPASESMELAVPSRKGGEPTP
jgi:GH43 family beta-xylosidase